MKKFDEKIYVPYTEAKELNGLGYDFYFEFHKDSEEELFDMRTDDDAPCILWGQAFKWFRNKGIYSTIVFEEDIEDENGSFSFGYEIRNFKTMLIDDDLDRLFISYEEAELACLRKLIDTFKSSS